MSDQLLFADRSERGKLRFTGEQRAWFLHQILTQAFEDMTPGEARDSAFLTVHGRMKAFMETLATDDSLLMHFEPELRDSLRDDLTRYIFATRVEIEDVTETMGAVLFVGQGWSDVARSDPAVVAVHPTSSLGVEAGYAWVDRQDLDALVGRLRDAGLSEASEDELEAIRIRNAVPRWGRDMDEKTFPQEAGVDSTAVHYDKGCYLGQEAMAKIHFRGRVNRRLAVLSAPAPLTAGAELMLDDVKIGTVTSAADASGLALVRYTVEAGTELDAGGLTVTVAS